MGRPQKVRTPEQRFDRLLAWATRQGLMNSADELREVRYGLERRQKHKSVD